MKEKKQIPTEQFRMVLENAYKYLFGFDKEAPEDMTLKELVDSMVSKYRTDSTISDERMALNIYSVCLASLISKDYAFRFIINEDGITCGVNIDRNTTYL